MTVTAQNAPERRDDERVNARLEGKLFLPDQEATFDCLILDLSAGGAGFHSAEAPPLDTFAVLYINGFGRFEGVVTRFAGGELGLRFACQEAKRKRLEQDLAGYVQEGMLGVTRLRRYPRSAPCAPIDHFTRANGDVVSCALLDISLQGASLRTSVLPPIGEVIALGATQGWVIRHFDDGVGIQFLQHAVPAGPAG